MDDNELVKYVWSILALKQRFERDPYSMSQANIKILEYYEDYLSEKIVQTIG